MGGINHQKWVVYGIAIATLFCFIQVLSDCTIYIYPSFIYNFTRVSPFFPWSNVKADPIQALGGGDSQSVATPRNELGVPTHFMEPAHTHICI